MTKVYHKSDRTNWGTPPELFEKVQASLQLSFDLDVCATEDNAKCERFLTPEDDALNPGTAWDGHYCWMNPPYGRGIGDWIRRARREGERRHVVALLPARVGTRWWWEGVVGSFPKAIIFLTGRVRFEGAENSAPFPSALVWWAGRRPGPPLGALWWDWKKDPPPFRHVGRTKERLMRYTAAIIATSDELPEWMNLSGQCRDDDA